MSGFRNIVVNGRHWKWRMGKGSVAAKDQVTGKGQHISFAAITGLSEYDVERAIHKGSLSITPKLVADWLNKFTQGA